MLVFLTYVQDLLPYLIFSAMITERCISVKKINKRMIVFYMVISAAELLVSFVIMFIRSHQLNLFSFTDSIGLASMIFLSTGLIIFIVQGGFFDGIAYSFRRFARTMRKRQLGDVDAEAPMAEYKIRNGYRWLITWPLILVSLLLFLLSLILSVAV